jgi:hypothetical protein
MEARSHPVPCLQSLTRSRSSAMVDFSTLGQSITTCFRMMLGYIDVYAPM